MSGSLSRNASNPRRTNSWSSTTSTPMVSSRPVSMSDAIRLRRVADSYDCPGPRCARDRDPSADLGRTAAHRVQAEVTRMPAGWVEAAPVVMDLDDDLLTLSLDPNVRDGGSGVPHDIRERLPSNGEQLRFHLLGQRQPRLRSPDIDGQPVGSAQPEGVSCERRDQPVVDRVAAQLEDQRANLALHAPGEVRDRVECSADRA